MGHDCDSQGHPSRGSVNELAKLLGPTDREKYIVTMAADKLLGKGNLSIHCDRWLQKVTGDKKHTNIHMITSDICQITAKYFMEKRREA